MSTLHHALLLVDEEISGIQRALEFFSVPEGSRGNDPDVHVFVFGQLGIDEARMLKQTASNRPIYAPHRSFIVATADMTGEAQNALLKLFEDPPSPARFALIVPREDMLIATLRSRLHKEDTRNKEAHHAVASIFLALSFEKRLKEIAARTKAKDDSWMEELQSGLERMWATLEHDGRTTALKEILFVRRYMNVRGASPKMLLEHLAVSLPVVA